MLPASELLVKFQKYRQNYPIDSVVGGFLLEYLESRISTTEADTVTYSLYASYADSKFIGTSAVTVLAQNSDRTYLELENLSDSAIITFRFDGIADDSPGCKRLFPGDNFSTSGTPFIATLALSVVSNEGSTPLTIGTITKVTNEGAPRSKPLPDSEGKA